MHNSVSFHQYISGSRYAGEWENYRLRETARCLRPAQQMLISGRKQQHHWFKKINKREKKENFVLVGITVSEVLVMAKITCNGTKRNMLFNPLSPMSDLNRISPYNVITISSRQVMRIKKNIN